METIQGWLAELKANVGKWYSNQDFKMSPEGILHFHDSLARNNIPHELEVLQVPDEDTMWFHTPGAIASPEIYGYRIRLLDPANAIGSNKQSRFEIVFDILKDTQWHSQKLLGLSTSRDIHKISKLCDAHGYGYEQMIGGKFYNEMYLRLTPARRNKASDKLWNHIHPVSGNKLQVTLTSQENSNSAVLGILEHGGIKGYHISLGQDLLLEIAHHIIKYYGDDYGDKEYEGEDLRGNPKTLTNTIKTQDKSTYAQPKYPPTGE